MKVVRNQLAEGGRLADAQRSLYDLIWMGVRDKVAASLLTLSWSTTPVWHSLFPGEAGAGSDDNRGAYWGQNWSGKHCCWRPLKWVLCCFRNILKLPVFGFVWSLAYALSCGHRDQPCRGEKGWTLSTLCYNQVSSPANLKMKCIVCLILCNKKVFPHFTLKSCSSWVQYFMKVAP